jgi:Tat protein translocase TatB subunit
MFDIGLPELLVILALALLVVGPEELPTLALRAGRLLYQFRRQYDELTAEIRRELEGIQREVEAAAGLLVSGETGAPATPALYAGALGAVAGRMPPSQERPLFQASALGPVCGRSLVQTTPLPPSREVTQIFPVQDGVVHGDRAAVEEVLSVQPQR